VAAWHGERATRGWLAAGWLLTCAIYGTVSLGRWWQSDDAAVLAAQARYHYAALATLALVVSVALSGLARRRPVHSWVAAGLLGLWVAATASAHAVWPPAIDLRDRARHQVDFAVGWMEARISAAPAGSDVTLLNRVLHIGGLPYIGMLDFPGWAGLFVIHFPTNTPRGHRVAFVEPHASVRARHRGRRSDGLLIAPADGPAGEVPAAATPPR